MTSPHQRRRRRLRPIPFAAILLAASCSSSTNAAVSLGPTQDETNTIAIVERFGPSTAALAVEVNGQRMGPAMATATDVDQEVLPRTDSPPLRSSGSGFLIEADGRRVVVSNFHVVQDTLEAGTSDMVEGATITAQFKDSDRLIPLRVVGVNPSFDLALLEAEGTAALPDLEPIPLGDSDQVVPGQKTVAIGNPFGIGVSVTVGTVSSTGRLVDSVGQVAVPMIQTDAAINPGNSGGALLNSSGELIGINTALFNPEVEAFAGIGFAVPSNLLEESLANLGLGGVSSIGDTRAVFGATLGALNVLPPDVLEAADLPSQGLAVLDVAAGGTADSAGLRSPDFREVLGIVVPISPDVVVAIDGERVRSVEDVNLAITYDAAIGQELTLTVLRDGAEVELPVTLRGG